jgi:enoyl-CoA hydratase/carnithine racemase
MSMPTLEDTQIPEAIRDSDLRALQVEVARQGRSIRSAQQAFSIFALLAVLIASERAMFGSFEARRGYHHGDGGIVRLVNACGVGVASHLLLTAEPIDAQQALQWNLVTKVVPHERLLEEAELVARQILRNSQRAVRSAKETILDVIGKDLDDQLRTEAWNAYTCADAEETLGLLQRFYDKQDAGRAGDHATGL